MPVPDVLSLSGRLHCPLPCFRPPGQPLEYDMVGFNFLNNKECPQRSHDDLQILSDDRHEDYSRCSSALHHSSRANVAYGQ